MLKAEETLEDLNLSGYKIIQSDNLYKFSSDAILLSRFAPKTSGKVADFCSGSGIVGLHYYAIIKDADEEFSKKIKVDLFEIQAELFEMSKRSIEYNGLNEVFTCYNIPLQEISEEFNGKYSLILCNPPYKKNFSGEKNQSEHIAICRHEIKITLEEIIEISALKLKRGGKLCICQRTERLTDILCLMRNYGLEPTRLQLVTAGKEKKPYLILVEGTKGVKPQLKVLPDINN